MEITLQRISPEFASDLLEGNTGNRTVNRNHVNFLAGQIKESAWKVTGDPIKLNASGRILDGQHRLMAIVQAGIAVEVFIAFGVPDEVFTVLDTGKVRTARDVLSIESLKSPNDQASLARSIMMHRERKLNTKVRAYTNQEVLDFCIENDLLIHVNLAAMYFKKGVMLTRTSVAFCSYIFHQLDPKKSGEFLDALCLGINVKPNSAMYLLREKLQKAYIGKYMYPKWEVIALVIKVWNLERTGGKVPSMIIYNPEKEEFPVAI